MLHIRGSVRRSGLRQDTLSELYRAEYINQFGSMRAFMREGYYGMIDCMDARLDEIDMRVAGGVIGQWWERQRVWLLGFLQVTRGAVTGEKGLLFFDYSQGVKAWRI